MPEPRQECPTCGGNGNIGTGQRDCPDPFHAAAHDDPRPTEAARRVLEAWVETCDEQGIVMPNSVRTAVASLAAHGDPIAAIDVVNEQAGDEGLWFVAQTMPEAYLQQELRRLHAAVEAGDPDA